LRAHQIPPEAAELTKLRTLAVENNKLTTLPPFVANFTALRSLNLSSNRFGQQEISKPCHS
jgi:Leucine-rich repeat (LRR) protein